MAKKAVAAAAPKTTKATASAAPKSTTPKSAAAKTPRTKSSADAAAKSTSDLLTLTDIGEHLAATFDMPKSHAKIYLSEAVSLIARHLRKGNKVRVAGLGVFQVKKRAARKGRNPSTGEAMKIKATKRVGFAVARDLKAKL